MASLFTRSVVFLGIAVALALSFAFVAEAWTGPTATPPGANVAAPINVSSTGQSKAGNLGVTGYLNFGATLGTSGYGMRDNAGTVEFKNSGGSWSSLQSTIYNYCAGGGCGSSSSFTGSGTANYLTKFTGSTALGNSSIYDNGSNVGIGTAGPDAKLFVNGASNWTRVGYGSYGLYTNGALAAYSSDANYWAGDFRAAGRYGMYVQNGSGYYDYIAYDSWGLYTNGNVLASDVYIQSRGLWASQLGRLGGQFWSVSSGSSQLFPSDIQCPSGSVVVGAGSNQFVSDVLNSDGYRIVGNFVLASVLCQWINQ